MKRHRFLLPLLAALALFSSCRKESSDFASFGYGEYLSLKYAQKDFATQFKMFWQAMSTNYAIWDYELEFGTDWDDVYDKYLPEFEALDRDYSLNDNPCPDSIFDALYQKVLDPLHDGHFYASMTNLHTGNETVISPSTIRHYKSIPLFNDVISFDPSLNYYASLPESDPKHCSLMLADSRRSPFKTLSDTIEYMRLSLEETSVNIQAAMGFALLPGAPETPSLSFVLHQLFPSIQHADSLLQTDEPDDLKLQQYNDYYTSVLQDIEATAATYNIPMTFPQATDQVSSQDIQQMTAVANQFRIQSALINGNIPYINISTFQLSMFLDEEYSDEFCTTKCLKIFRRHVIKVWEDWFNNVQRLSADRQLKGVIIDLRSNSGGMTDDFQYLAGALLDQEKTFAGYQRVKDGIGRFDYAPAVPLYFKACQKEHATVTQPIVVLTNQCSVSMSEMTSLVITYLPNGYTVGKQTFGGFSGLLGTPELYSYSYSGVFGKEEDSFYGYAPYMVTMNRDGKIMEGFGIRPLPENDIDIDYNEFDNTGIDPQLERAIELIQSK